MTRVVFLNPRTCGIYKDGEPRYKTDPETGTRTTEIDNELIASVESYLAGRTFAWRRNDSPEPGCRQRGPGPDLLRLTPQDRCHRLLRQLGTQAVTVGELLDSNIISVRGGHGSPGNDQRTGTIPYIKVSDIRGLRINVNPTNLVTESVAKRIWRGTGVA